MKTALEELQANPQDVLANLGMDLGPGLSFGTVCGFASGFTLKKAGKVAVVVRILNSRRLSLLRSRSFVLLATRRPRDALSLLCPPPSSISTFCCLICNLCSLSAASSWACKASPPRA